MLWFPPDYPELNAQERLWKVGRKVFIQGGFPKAWEADAGRSRPAHEAGDLGAIENDSLTGTGGFLWRKKPRVAPCQETEVESVII